MASNPGPSPAGSSTYQSGSMHVGDGTWDSSRDSFLLPNIQGLNFDTMRYNGMGNRFRALEEYHPLITAHGVFAAITFLGVVPTAIFIAKFYHPDPRLALRIHISLQILTVILATVILLLGYFAVGPSRSLTNPHHGIGVAIYVLVLVQAIGGAIIHRVEKGKIRYYIPVKLMLHQWMGRAIALLALAQIPIGLTLYGSPAFLFVLYTLVVAFLVVLYFVLTFRQHKRIAAGLDERGSYVSGTQTDMTGQTGNPRHKGRLGTLTGAVAGGAGIAALRRRFSNRDKGRDGSDQYTDVSGSGMHSRVDSSSYLTEKYSDAGRRDGNHTWRNRLLGGPAGVGAFAGLRRVFDRRKSLDRDHLNESEQAAVRRPPLGGPVTPSMDHVDRLEAGLPVSDGDRRWRNVEQRERAQATMDTHTDLSQRTGDSSGEYASEGSYVNRGSRLGPLAGIAGAVGLGGWLSRRRRQKEQQRIDAQRRREMEEERLYRPVEQQPLYPGDDTPHRDGGVRFDSNLPGNSINNQQQTGTIPPPPQSQAMQDSAPGTAAPALDPYAAYHPHPQSIPPPPANTTSQGPLDRSNNQRVSQQSPYADLPPVPPLHQSGANSAASAPKSPTRQPQGPYVSNQINNTINNRPPAPNFQPGAPPRGGLQQPQPVASPPRMARNSAYASPGPPGESPAVSLRVKPGRDGRHVTVQQLSAEEAVQQRERHRQRRGSSGSAGMRSPPSSAPQYAAQYSQQAVMQTAAGQQTSPQGAVSGLGSSPGTTPANGAPGGYDNGTESYDNRRRRRRAERARNLGVRQGAEAPSAAGRVDFE